MAFAIATMQNLASLWDSTVTTLVVEMVAALPVPRSLSVVYLDAPGQAQGSNRRR
jgi:hypothetical protein